MIWKKNKFNLISKNLKLIESNGYEAYLVGGYVRDKLLGVESNDFDITTNARPIDIINIFGCENCNSDNYGSVVIKYNNIRFEVTTYRKDIQYDDKRKPVEIKYIDDLNEDLKRRDFIINTICMDKNGKIVDLLDGRSDLKNKIINSVGDANKKFREDPLRMLRAIRFATLLNFNLSDEIKESILINKYLIRNLSYERKREELDKIFISKNVNYGIKLMNNLEIDKELEIDLSNVKYFNDILGTWALINNNDYIFTKNERNIVKSINKVIKLDNKDSFVLYKYGLYVNQIAYEIKGFSKKEIAKTYQKLPIKSRDDIQINGEEIMELLNIESSPLIKDIYLDLENEILNHNLKNKNVILKKYIVDKYKK